MRDDQLARILADPDNDQLRLEIAEELGPGSMRAEFMRLQIERHTRDRLAKRARRSDESAREEAILSMYGDRWAKEVGDFILVPPDYRGIAFHRGMVARARVRTLEQADQAFSRAPIEVLEASSADFDALQMLKAPWLSRLRALIISGNSAGDALALALTNCPELIYLRYLELSHNRFTEAGIEALIASPNLARVARVDLAGNPCNPVEKLTYDEAGYAVVSQRQPFGKRMLERYGRAWLNCPWDHRDEEPDVWM